MSNHDEFLLEESNKCLLCKKPKCKRKVVRDYKNKGGKRNV